MNADLFSAEANISINVLFFYLLFKKRMEVGVINNILFGLSTGF